MNLHSAMAIGMGCLLSAACARREPTPNPRGTDIVPEFTAQMTPSSRRSSEAIARVAPNLIRDLEVRGLAYGAPVFLRVFKREREVELWVAAAGGYERFRGYAIAAMSGDLGPKRREGDRQAPEGFYAVAPGQMNPNSRYHLAFDIGYPNAYDRAQGWTGSHIMVHGNRVSIGCFAMTDEKIEEIYALVDAALRNGQAAVPVHIFPFRFGEGQPAEADGGSWRDFWLNLREGYDDFERKRRPPSVRVVEGRYAFE